jgi:hypothetical protein
MPSVDETIQGLLLTSIVIALGFLVAVAFYESLCDRDVLVGRIMRFTRRRTGRRGMIATAYALSVFVGIPILVVVWTQVLEITLVFVGSVQRLGNVALVATAVVAAARMLAYIREKTAHELAKAIPMSLAIILLTGGALNLEANMQLAMDRPELISLTPEMIAFLLIVEIGSRLITDASQAVLATVRSRRGIESDAGVWRTLWLAIRRPLASVVPPPRPLPPPDA